MLGGELSETPGISRDFLYKLPDMTGIFNGTGPVFEAANSAFNALFEGKGMVCRIIDGTRDNLMQYKGMSKDQANDTVLKVRQLFFDPFASPGVHPTTDPEFKKMLPMFQAMTEILVDGFHYGASNYDREGAENFAAKFVEYAKENFKSGPPTGFTQDKLNDMVNQIMGHKSSILTNSADYDYIQVTSWEELKKLSNEYHLGTWCIVQNESDWEKFTSYGESKFYLLVADNADQDFSRLSVIGIVVNSYGNVVYAFDRDNFVTDKDAITEIANKYGLTEPFANSFGPALDLLNKSQATLNIFPYCEEIYPGYYMVGGFKNNSDYVILYEGGSGYRYITNIFNDISQVYKSGGRLWILDGNNLLDLDYGDIIFSCSESEYRDFSLASDGFDDDNMLFFLKSNDWRKGFINAISIDEHDNTLLLDKNNDHTIRSAEFDTSNQRRSPGLWSSGKLLPKFPTISHMEDGDFWTIETQDGYYIVDKPGKLLDDCIFIKDMDNLHGITILSPNGYYTYFDTELVGAERENVYYLMKNGKKVFECPFIEICRASADSFDIGLTTMSGENFILDTKTGKLRRADN